MEDGVGAAIAGDGDDLGFAGGAVLRVLDAVGFCGKVRSKFGSADDDLEVGGLVQTLGFAGVDAGDNSFQRDVGVCTSDRSGGGVVGAGCGGFDVGDGLAPVVEDGGGDGGESVVDEAHINLGINGRRSWRRHPCNKGRGRTGARGIRRRRC